MVHLLVVHDNCDINLGEYFAASSEHLQRKTNAHCNIQVFDSEKIIEGKLPELIRYLNQEKDTPFVIVCYTHGAEDALLLDNENFIDKENAYLFGESLFYACACRAGKELREYLMHYKCRFFMGYKDRITTSNPEDDAFFYHCENAVIERFLSTNETIEQCLAYMYDQYTQMICQVSPFTAGVLAANLNAFVSEGDTKLKRDDFRAV